MRDRIPAEGKAGRMLITPENGSAPFYATVTMADEPVDEGTPLNKANLLTDETAAMFEKDSNATINNIFAELGIYNQHWWRMRNMDSHYKEVHGTAEVMTVNYGPNSRSFTLRYSESVEINPSTGEISLRNPTEVEVGYDTDISATVIGKYVESNNGYGIYFVGAAATHWGSFDQSDGTSIFGSYLDDCYPVSSEFVDAIGDYYFKQSNDRSAYPDVGTIDGVEYEYLGRPFESAATAIQIQTGWYVGTGSSETEFTKEFSCGFRPKLFILCNQNPTISSTTSVASGLIVWLEGVETVTAADIKGNYDREFLFEQTATGLILNGEAHDYPHFNYSQYTYRWIAIG